MDAEVKQHLEGMEARIMQHAADTEARMMQHAAETEARIMQRVGGRIDAAEERLKAHTSSECEKIETKLLTEFHKWGRTADMRTRQTMEANAIMNDRLMNAEDRITNLERSKVPPPNAEAA